MMKKFAFLLVALISIAGCTTTPIPTNKAVDVPSERVFNKTLLNDGADRGAVIVKRDSGHVGNACYSIVYMDGKEIAYLDPGEKFEFYPPVGDHILGAQPKGMCGGSTSELSITVRSGEKHTFRVGYDSGVIFRLSPTAF